MSTFKLEIELGNAAMQRPDDVAELLGQAASEVAEHHVSGKLRDRNGNTVGGWRLEGDYPVDEGEEV